MYSSLNRIAHPTNEQRHGMLKQALDAAGRPEDYEYIHRLLSPSPDITSIVSPGELRGIKIGIIGGGLAGLTAAYELRKTGADITLLEASKDRIGGRVYSYFFDPEEKYYGEFGALSIPLTHETTWHYINLFRLNTLPMISMTHNNFLYVHNTRNRTTESSMQYLYPKYALTPQERNTPWPELSEYALKYRFLQLPPEIRAELISVLPSYSPDFIPLMDMSLRDNFKDLGLSQAAINLISDINPTSGALLANSYDETAQGEYTLDHINTYCIQDGNVNLPLAIYSTFSSSEVPGYSNIPKESLGNVTFKPGHCVTGIYQSDYRSKIVVKYTNNTEAGDTADIYDYVICAIPLSTLRTIEIKPYFNNWKMRAILELNYIDAMKSLFLCNRRFWERNTDYGNMVGGVSYTDLPIQSIIYPEDYSPEDPGVLTASYNLMQNSTRVGGMQDPVRYELIRQNVEEVHGLPRGFLNSFVERHHTVHWNNEPLHRGAMACTLPGQKRLFAYELQQPEYHGRLYFAGEHVSNKHGSMQGALSSGKDAANRLAEHFHKQY